MTFFHIHLPVRTTGSDRQMTGSGRLKTGNEYIPVSARPRAISVPIPDVAPVTMATGAMLWTEKKVFLFFWLCHDAQVVLGL